MKYLLLIILVCSASAGVIKGSLFSSKDMIQLGEIVNGEIVFEEALKDSDLMQIRRSVRKDLKGELYFVEISNLLIKNDKVTLPVKFIIKEQLKDSLIKLELSDTHRFLIFSNISLKTQDKPNVQGDLEIHFFNKPTFISKLVISIVLILGVLILIYLFKIYFPEKKRLKEEKRLLEEKIRLKESWLQKIKLANSREDFEAIYQNRNEWADPEIVSTAKSFLQLINENQYKKSWDEEILKEIINKKEMMNINNGI